MKDTSLFLQLYEKTLVAGIYLTIFVYLQIHSCTTMRTFSILTMCNIEISESYCKVSQLILEKKMFINEMYVLPVNSSAIPTKQKFITSYSMQYQTDNAKVIHLINSLFNYKYIPVYIYFICCLKLQCTCTTVHWYVS